MYRILFTLIVSIFAVSSVYSDNQNVALWGHVKDGFTNGGIRDVKITLMTADSVAVDSQMVSYFNEDKSYMDSYYKFTIPAVPRRYIIKAEHPDYESCYVDINIQYIARNEYFDAPFHYMERRISREIDLNQVEIKATKIKFVYKNDTLIYNADAFKLPNGSMLDELARQMPGVKLTVQGEIYMNGKKVDNLLLQGENFFKSDKSIALKNLPAYVVKNVSFYDRTTDKSRYLGFNADKPEFVMDVRLKKEYAQGYIANAEIGGGTHERYSGRIFGLRYTPHSRFSLYGTMNNLNDYLRPGSDGEWSKSNISNGVLTSKGVGMNWMVANQEETVRNELGGNVQWRSLNNETNGLTTTFLPTHENYTVSASKNKLDGLFALATNELTIQRPFYISSYTMWQYIKTDVLNSSFSSTYGHDPFMGKATDRQRIDYLSQPGNEDSSWVNRQTLQEDGSGYRSSLSQTVTATRKLPWGDHLNLTLDGGYTSIHSTMLRDYMVRYLLEQRSEQENQYLKEPSRSYDYRINLEYNIHLLSNWNYNLKYSYRQDYRHETHDLYRLDWLYNRPEGNVATQGLPSSHDSLSMALDHGNSYRIREHKRTQQGVVQIFFDDENDHRKTRFDITLPLAFERKRMSYQRAASDTVARSDNWLFTPTVSYRYSKKTGLNFETSYGMEMATPMLEQAVDYTDTSNSLLIYRGNRGLKKSVSHSFNARLQNRLPKVQGLYQISAGLRFDHGLVGNAVFYQEATGVYTYQPRNINGNWSGTAEAGISLALDKSRLWYLENSNCFTFNHNVDFMAVGSAGLGQSSVDNIYSSHRLSLAYQKNDLRASLVGNLGWHHSRSLMNSFEPFSVFDFNYGTVVNYTMAKILKISTDLRMYSRRGYSTGDANTNYLIWNISLDKSLLHDRLLLRLTGYDILQQFSNHSYEVNGQGRTEQFYNSIPSYVMLSVEYKLRFAPRRSVANK